MNHQPQFQQPSLRPQSSKTLLVRAIDWISIILALVTSLFVSPFLIRATQEIFTNYMTLVWGAAAGFYELIWLIICHLFIGASALIILQVKLTGKITKIAMNGFK